MASCGFLLWTRRPLQCRRFAHVSLTNADYGEYISIQEYNIFIICNRFGGRIEHHRKSKTRSWTGSSKWVNNIFGSDSNQNSMQMQMLLNLFFVCIAFHFIYDAKKNKLKDATFNRIFYLSLSNAMSWSWIFIHSQFVHLLFNRLNQTFLSNENGNMLVSKKESCHDIYSCWRLLKSKDPHVCVWWCGDGKWLHWLSTLWIEHSFVFWWMLLSPILFFFLSLFQRHSNQSTTETVD